MGCKGQAQAPPTGFATIARNGSPQRQRVSKANIGQFAGPAVGENLLGGYFCIMAVHFLYSSGSVFLYQQLYPAKSGFKSVTGYPT